MTQASPSAAAEGEIGRKARSSADHLPQMSVGDPRVALFLQMPPAERTKALAAMLEGAAGRQFRQQASQWVVQMLSVKRLVPQVYAEWRPLVRDAMLYFGSHLSTARLAPKLVEQFALPLGTSPEKRLSRLIAGVPGLQKLGQVIARNRHLHSSLRRELTRLENGIGDVSAGEIRTIIEQALGPSLQRYSVKIAPTIFCEASVSAVVRFTWFNPARRRRERGVFKVMKPYVRAYFAEDMELLGQLAKHLGSKHKEYGFAERTLPETFQDVRRLLQHEVEFGREQENLCQAARVYSAVGSVRIPQVIRPLSTSTITALTEERGDKITKAVAGIPDWSRRRIAERLIDAVLAVPLLTPDTKGMLHADPHAGNLLYNRRNGVLTLLDWALTAHITEEQRRQIALLFVMILLRDTRGVCEAIESLSLRGQRRWSGQTAMVRQEVEQFFEEQPLAHIPQAVDVMNLLERITWQGVRLPSPLVMLRKVLFTLDGILHDVAGSRASIESVMVQRLLRTWLEKPARLGWPLSLRDWLGVNWSAMFYGGRLAMAGFQRAVAWARTVPEDSWQTENV